MYELGTECIALHCIKQHPTMFFVIRWNDHTNLFVLCFRPRSPSIPISSPPFLQEGFLLPSLIPPLSNWSIALFHSILPVRKDVQKHYAEPNHAITKEKQVRIYILCI